MSLYDYNESKKIEASFAAIIMAALRKADDVNAMLLRSAFPDICDELRRRYDAPGGLLPEDKM